MAWLPALRLRQAISRISTRRQFDCDSCRYRFSVTTGTVFHDSHLPLPKWFLAVLLMCEAKKGISANQMKRTLGVAHKTAWYLCHRIREAMRTASPEPLCGTVEVDETYVGGKRQARRPGLPPQQGDGHGCDPARRRHSLVGRKALRKATLQGFIATTSRRTLSTSITDEHPGYQGLDSDSGDEGRTRP